MYSGLHAELSIFCCSLYELGYVRSNATRGCTAGYSKVITQEEAPSSPPCMDGASGSLVLPDEWENTSDDNPGKLQVHIIVMCMEIQALQQTSWGHRESYCIWEWWEDPKQFLGSKVSFFIFLRDAAVVTFCVWLSHRGQQTSSKSQDGVKWIFQSVTINVCQEGKKTPERPFLIMILNYSFFKTSRG